ncbi:MAG: 3'-5' exonuclease [archaeon]|nr:3'-5' exonuclease [archaeon]
MIQIYHVLDIETTGFNAKTDEICELAFLTCRGTQILDIYHNFFTINEISTKAQEVNGFSVEQLKGWNPLKNEIPRLRSLLIHTIFAHNSVFDCGFLKEKGIIHFEHRIIDTLKLCRNDHTNLDNNKLKTWLQYYNISHRPHGALSDAFGLYKLITLKGWQVL